MGPELTQWELEQALDRACDEIKMATTRIAKLEAALRRLADENDPLGGLSHGAFARAALEKK